MITYLTSKEWEKYQVGTYKTDPSRTSTFNDPDLVASAPYLPVSGQAFEAATILPLAQVPETFEIMTACAEEFGTALTGDARRREPPAARRRTARSRSSSAAAALA